MTSAAQRTALCIVAAMLMVTAWWLVAFRDDVAPRSAPIDPSPTPAPTQPALEAPVAAELQGERQPGTSLEVTGPTATGTHRAGQPPGPSAQRTGGKVAPTTRAQREYFANTILASHGTTVVANIVEETRREWRAKLALASAGANFDEAVVLVEEYAQVQLQYWLAFYAAMDRYVRNEPDPCIRLATERRRRKES